MGEIDFLGFWGKRSRKNIFNFFFTQVGDRREFLVHRFLMERRCYAYANLAKTDVANDAAIWNFRFVIAATPQSVFAKVMQTPSLNVRDSLLFNRLMRPCHVDCGNCIDLAKRSRGVALAAMRRQIVHQMKSKGEGVGMRRSEAEGSPNEVSREAVARGRATQVSPNSAYAKHLRSKPAHKGSNEFS